MLRQTAQYSSYFSFFLYGKSDILQHRALIDNLHIENNCYQVIAESISAEMDINNLTAKLSQLTEDEKDVDNGKPVFERTPFGKEMREKWFMGFDKGFVNLNHGSYICLSKFCGLPFVRSSDIRLASCPSSLSC